MGVKNLVVWVSIRAFADYFGWRCLFGVLPIGRMWDNFRDVKLSQYYISLFFFRFYGLLKSLCIGRCNGIYMCLSVDAFCRLLFLFFTCRFLSHCRVFQCSSLLLVLLWYIVHPGRLMSSLLSEKETGSSQRQVVLGAELHTYAQLCRV